MKYIIFEKTKKGYQNTLIIPVIFSEHLSHKEMRDIFIQGSICVQPDDTVIPVSAGFYNTVTGVCYGNSVSLRLESRKGNTEIMNINKYFPYKN